MKRYVPIALGLALSFLFGAGVRAGSPQEAVVCLLKGNVFVNVEGGGNRQPVTLFQWVGEGTRIEVEPSSRVVLAFSNGRRFELTGKTSALLRHGEVKGEGIRELEAVNVIPRLATMGKGSAPGVKQGGIRLRGDDGTHAIRGLYPSGGSTLLAQQAEFSFSPGSNTERYRVDIEDEQGNNVFSAETRDARVLVSPGVLRPGEIYLWRVRTLGPVRPSIYGEAVFETVSEVDAKTHKELAGRAASASDPSLLLLLARFEQGIGLNREACQSLHKANEMIGAEGAPLSLPGGIDCSQLP